MLLIGGVHIGARALQDINFIWFGYNALFQSLDPGMNPTLTLAVRRSNHSARSHPHYIRRMGGGGGGGTKNGEMRPNKT